jgi:hypothetical protein
VLAIWRLNPDDLPFDLFFQGKDADSVTAGERSSWRTGVKKIKPAPIVVGSVMGMTIYKTIQGWKFAFNAFF